CDGDHAVAAGSIFHDDGLTPTRGKLVGEQPCADIDAATWAKGYDEMNRPVGPSIGRDARSGQQRRQRKDGNRRYDPGFQYHGSSTGRPLKVVAVAALL